MELLHLFTRGHVSHGDPDWIVYTRAFWIQTLSLDHLSRVDRDPIYYGPGVARIDGGFLIALNNYSEVSCTN